VYAETYSHTEYFEPRPHKVGHLGKCYKVHINIADSVRTIKKSECIV